MVWGPRRQRRWGRREDKAGGREAEGTRGGGRMVGEVHNKRKS